VEISGSARAIIESGRIAHLVTLNRDGSPQISCVWVGLDGDELISGHLRADQQKLLNVRVAVERLAGMGPWTES
jgi:hypothetical protein